MTKPKARVLKREKNQLTLAEQFAALGNLRDRVRRIEADCADRNANPDGAWSVAAADGGAAPRRRRNNRSA
jgi:hypothetical protein